MAYFERPNSIELEVQKTIESGIRLKQTEVLKNLIGVCGKNINDPAMPILAFQRNNPDTFTITLKAREEWLILENKLNQTPIRGPFKYRTSTADVRGGTINILGCPAEYPISKLKVILDFPQNQNGVLHAHYKKTYKPVPHFIMLPEGIKITLKINDESENGNKCFTISGDHMA